MSLIYVLFDKQENFLTMKFSQITVACFPYHVLFAHSVAEWTIPTLTGDIPPPITYFSFTQISSDTAVMFGGNEAGHYSSELYPATVGKHSVVCA